VLLTDITGQLYEPYADNPETNGFMRIPTEVLEKFIPLFLRDGWQVVGAGLWTSFATEANLV
jgi:hypothetical protein